MWDNLRQWMALRDRLGAARGARRRKPCGSMRRGGEAEREPRLRSTLVELLEPRQLLCAEHLAGAVVFDQTNPLEATSFLIAPSDPSAATDPAGPRQHAAQSLDSDLFGDSPAGQSGGFGGSQFLGAAISYSLTAAGLPILHSLPGASAALYLDFDGDTATDSDPYDTDGSPSTFNATEQKVIAEAWRHISNYFAMFNVDVTTIYSATQKKAWHISGNNISGGYSYVGVFPNSKPESFNESGDAASRQSGIAHEFGHNFGLSHQSLFDQSGVKTTEYRGELDTRHGSIMGVDYAGTVHKWWHGHPSGSPSLLQDDLKVIADRIKAQVGGDGYRTDDYGGTIATAAALTTSGGLNIKSGIIEKATDLDAFSFASAGGEYAIAVGMDYPSALEAEFEVRDSAGVLIAKADNPGFNDAQLKATLGVGTYYVIVSSRGDYGDVGTYNVVVAPAVSEQSANWTNRDIGGVGRQGFSHYDATANSFTVAGSGADIWGSADEFQYAAQKLTGDGSIEARVVSLDPTDSNAKTGVMIRASLDANAMHAAMLLTSSNGAKMTRRTASGGASAETNSGSGAFIAKYVRLVRSGNSFSGYVKTNAGDAWTLVTTQTVTMGSTVYIGLASTAHSDGAVNYARFENVVLTGALSNANAAAPTLNALTAPIGLAVTATAANSVSLSWTDGAGESGYTIERSTDNVIFTTAGATAANLTTFVDPGRTAALQHFYRVRANGSGGTVSVPSTTVSTVTRSAAVANFTLSTWTTTQIILDWRDTIGETGYRVERSTNGTTWTTLTALAANVPSFTNSGLAANTQYFYRVVTLDASGDAAISPVLNRLTQLPAVTTLSVVSQTSSSVTLSWSNLTGETVYVVQRSTDGTTFTTVATLGADVTTYSNSGLSPFTKYVYRVFGRNGTIDGTAKDVAAVTNGNTVPNPWTVGDIGTSLFVGKSHYSNGVYSDYIGSNDVWGTADNFRFTRIGVNGDASIVAKVESVEDVAGWAKAGLMIRESAATNSRYAFIMISPDNGAAFQYRKTAGGQAVGVNTVGPAAPYWVKLTRVGNLFTGYSSPDGVNWTAVGSVTFAMNANTLIGLAHTSNNASATNPGRADFSNVKIESPNVAPSANGDTYFGIEDTPLNGNLLNNDLDVNGNPLTAAVLANPANGSVLINSNGSFTYTPNANFNGIDSFTYQANDGILNSAAGTVTISVAAVNDPPVAVNDAFNVNPGLSLNGNVTANDTDVEGSPLSAVTMSNPTQGSLTLNSDGTFTYVPNPAAAGSDSFTYLINDGAVNSNIATVSINFSTINTPPVANNDNLLLAEDATRAGNVLANDSDLEGNTITAELAAPPTKGNVTLNPDGSYVYTPNLNANGSDRFTYTANDGLLTSAPATVLITITPVNDAPIGVADSFTVSQNGVLNGNVLTNDLEVDGDPLTAVPLINPTKGILVLNSDGSFVYTPNPSAADNDSFSYIVSDGVFNSLTTLVDITIAQSNNPPLANADSLTLAEDTVGTGNVLTNDTDPQGNPLTAILVAPPLRGILTLRRNGEYSYTPQANYFGGDSFTYLANNGSLDSPPSTVTLIVTNVNDAPVAMAEEFSLEQASELTINPLANDVDDDGDWLTIHVAAPPTHGALSINDDGTVTYTPEPGYAGIDSFTYAAFDGAVASASVIVALTVNGAAASPPTALPDDLQLNANQTIVAGSVLANDLVNGGGELTAELVAGTAHGALTLNGDGTFTYTPTANYHGADSFTYRALNGDLASDPTAVAIVIAEVGEGEQNAITPPMPSLMASPSAAAVSNNAAPRFPIGPLLLSARSSSLAGNPPRLGMGSLTAAAGTSAADGGAPSPKLLLQRIGAQLHEFFAARRGRQR